MAYKYPVVLDLYLMFCHVMCACSGDTLQMPMIVCFLNILVSTHSLMSLFAELFSLTCVLVTEGM